MEWIDLKTSGLIFEELPRIWAAEEAAPVFFRNANKTWTKDLKSYCNFAEGCQYIYGLYDDGKLALCVYFEQHEGDPTSLFLHLSVVGKMKPEIFLAKTTELRDQLFHGGVKRIRGWLLTKNFGLRCLMGRLGFIWTGIGMDHGTSHGRPLRWRLMEVINGA